MKHISRSRRGNVPTRPTPMRPNTVRQDVQRLAVQRLAEDIAEEVELLTEDEDVADDLDDEQEEYTAASYTTGRLILMPSGGKLRIRPFSLISALKRGTLPAPLVAAAREMINGPEDKIAELRRKQAERERRNAPNSKPAPDGVDGQFAVMDYMVSRMIASFDVVEKSPDECQDGEVSIEQIFEADKICLISYAMQGQKVLEDFR